MATTESFACDCEPSVIHETRASLAKHMQEVHQVDLFKTEWMRIPESFMDGSGWSAQSYRYELKEPDVVFHRTVTIRRE